MKTKKEIKEMFIKLNSLDPRSEEFKNLNKEVHKEMEKSGYKIWDFPM